jgi:hypothetical protein
MATNQSSSPHHSPQFSVRMKPAPAQTTSLVEQQLRLSVESPQLLAAIDILLPLAKAAHRRLSCPQSTTCDPRIAERIKSEADTWAIGIALAEDSLSRIKPYSHVLLRFFHRFEAAIKAKKVAQL